LDKGAPGERRGNRRRGEEGGEKTNPGGEKVHSRGGIGRKGGLLTIKNVSDAQGICKSKNNQGEGG